MIYLLLLAGLFMGWSLGTNDAAYAQTGVAANLLTDARLAAAIGGIAIAVGVLSFSKRVMMTVGTSIAEISQIEGFLVILSMALTVVIMGNWMRIPVSTSQAVVGAVIGAGLTRGVKAVRFGVLKNIALAWVSSPTIAGLLTYLVAIASRSYFG